VTFEWGQCLLLLHSILSFSSISHLFVWFIHINECMYMQVVLNDFFEFRFDPVSIHAKSSFLLDMRNMINNEDLSDVTFIVEGEKVSIYYSLIFKIGLIWLLS
jgi:hypothetical protein